MTYDSIYSIGGIKGSKPEVEMSLYEAAKRLVELWQDGKVTDSTCIRCKGRCVGFYCEWDNYVKAMFGAGEDEKYLLNSWKMHPVRRVA